MSNMRTIGFKSSDENSHRSSSERVYDILKGLEERGGVIKKEVNEAIYY
jgi:hypothetical protein